MSNPTPSTPFGPFHFTGALLASRYAPHAPSAQLPAPGFYARTPAVAYAPMFDHPASRSLAGASAVERPRFRAASAVERPRFHASGALDWRSIVDPFWPSPADGSGVVGPGAPSSAASSSVPTPEPGAPGGGLAAPIAPAQPPEAPAKGGGEGLVSRLFTGNTWLIVLGVAVAGVVGYKLYTER